MNTTRTRKACTMLDSKSRDGRRYCACGSMANPAGYCCESGEQIGTDGWTPLPAPATTGPQLELVPAEEVRGQLTIAGALEELPATIDLLALLASGTSKWHATRAGGWEALCGTDTALPLRNHGELTTEAAAVLLNDRHLDGGPVCQVCRAKVNVAAMTGAQL